MSDGRPSDSGESVRVHLKAIFAKSRVSSDRLLSTVEISPLNSESRFAGSKRAMAWLHQSLWNSVVMQRKVDEEETI